ncbi:hypothetical protein [Methylocaldum marinum]|uniref:hypothetical protein n=1 Tax=Methylocaldum marinum TaxID=1432792 RepID=UPI000E6844E9|nr:hypothetical protein [Methylocaldum marinum]
MKPIIDVPSYWPHLIPIELAGFKIKPFPSKAQTRRSCRLSRAAEARKTISRAIYGGYRTLAAGIQNPGNAGCERFFSSPIKQARIMPSKSLTPAKSLAF